MNDHEQRRQQAQQRMGERRLEAQGLDRMNHQERARTGRQSDKSNGRNCAGAGQKAAASILPPMEPPEWQNEFHFAWDGVIMKTATWLIYATVAGLVLTWLYTADRPAAPIAVDLNDVNQVVTPAASVASSQQHEGEPQ